LKSCWQAAVLACILGERHSKNKKAAEEKLLQLVIKRFLGNG
jgi:hypothetical protein